MKKVLALSLLLLWAAPAGATVYVDSTGETIWGPNSFADIASAVVTNTATDITFSINMAGGDIGGADPWAKYLIIMDTTAGGDPAGNGWARPIDMPSGADQWVGTWVDGGGGAQLWDYDISMAGAWNLIGAPGLSFGGTNVTITVSLASVGLTLGNSFTFDIFTSGGGAGDGAIDSLGNPAQQIANWGDQSSAVPLTYTTPEPAALTLLALGGVALLRRRR